MLLFYFIFDFTERKTNALQGRSALLAVLFDIKLALVISFSFNLFNLRVTELIIPSSTRMIPVHRKVLNLMQELQ